jgi:hypothetical protein
MAWSIRIDVNRSESVRLEPVHAAWPLLATTERSTSAPPSEREKTEGAKILSPPLAA